MTLFRNVNIVKENTVEKGEVLVRDGKIAEVAPTIETPLETEIVDGGGRYLSLALSICTSTAAADIPPWAGKTRS